MWIVWCVLCRRNLCLIGSFTCMWCNEKRRNRPGNLTGGA